MSDYINRKSLIDNLNCFVPEAYSRAVDSIISQEPAADVAEVRHGRWIEDERTYPGPGLKNNLCSVCGEIAGAWKEGLAPERKWAYCPNCGARMGKEDGHEAG